MAQGKPYQYYTIISETVTGKDYEENDEQIVYLTVEPQTTISSTADANSLEEVETQPGLKLITLGDGRLFLTSNDETYDVIEPQLIRNDDNGENQDETKKAQSDYQIVEVVENDSSHFIRMLYYDEPNLVTESLKKEKSFVCSYEGCGKMYSMLHHLNVHMRNHLDSKPYVCNEEGCHKTFSTNYSLKAHIRTHTGEKPYSCTICPKCFKTSGDLQKHIRIHTGEKPFMCPIEGCGKSFTTSNIRKVHIRSHTGERPYSCDYPNCGKAFSSSTNYKNHIRIHSGEKPYICSIEGCGKRFTEYSSLYKHNLVHQPDRPLTCEYCSQKFKQESSINIHKRVKHNVVVTRDGTEVVVNID